MSDKPLGTILATAIAVPVAVLCCVGGLALVGSAAAALTSLLAGSGILLSALISVAAGLLALMLRRRLRAFATPIRHERNP